VAVSYDNPTGDNVDAAGNAASEPFVVHRPDDGNAQHHDPVRRCHASILFSDLCASTTLGEMLDPEIFAKILLAVRNTAEQVISRYGGFVNQFYGDGFLAVFGFPHPAKGDARRAIEAAIELHRVVRELPLQRLLPSGFRLRLHSGVDAGLIAAQQGDNVQGHYCLTGDALNAAQRLAMSALDDEIFASTSSLQGVREFFITGELQKLVVKNKILYAHHIVRRHSNVITDFDARVLRGLTPFVGREAELRSLNRGLQAALAGKLQLVSVVGDAGVGKTRLVDAFLRQQPAGRFQVHRTYCRTEGAAIPLQPFMQLLLQLFQPDPTATPAQLAQHLDTQLAALGSIDDLSQHGEIASQLLNLLATDTYGATPRQSQSVTAIVQLLHLLATRKPQVVFIDDWHGADDASRQVISELLLSSRDHPILILTTARSLDPIDPMAAGSLLQLGPFEFDDSKQLIDTLIPSRPEIGTAECIHERAGGNVFFIEELCQLLRADGRKPELHNVPTTLSELIEARVNRLPRTLLAVLRAAAIIGNVFSRALLARVREQELDHDSLGALIDADLVYAGDSDDRLRFKHGITREVVFASIPLQQRRQLHLRVANVLEQDMAAGSHVHSEALAHHFEGADEPARAIVYAERAGDRALAAASLDSARQHYFLALKLLKTGDSDIANQQLWISISKRWALACTYSPAPYQLEILEQTAQYATALEDAAGHADAQYWMGWINYGLGDQRASIAHYKKAFAIAKKHNDSKTVTQIMTTMGQSYAAAADYPQALALLSEAIAIKEQHRSPHANAPVGSAYGKACKAFVLADLGEFDTAIMLIESAITAVQDHNQAIEASILNIYAVILLWRGDWNNAFDIARRAQRVAERINGPYVFAMSQAAQSYARWMDVRGTDALESLQQASTWLEQQQMCLFISLTYGWLADAMATEGNYAQAKKYAFAALERAETSDVVGAAMACRALAVIAQYEPDPQMHSTQQYLQQALQFAQKRNSAHDIAVTQRQLGQFLSESGDNGGESERLLVAARTAFNNMGMAWFATQAN